MVGRNSFFVTLGLICIYRLDLVYFLCANIELALLLSLQTYPLLLTFYLLVKKKKHQIFILRIFFSHAPQRSLLNP